MDPYIGQIQPFAFQFAPRGWAQCNGQLLAITQNAALFSLLGTTYGGNGTTNFALPDFRSRAPMHWGAGPGLSNRVLGEKSGVETVTLSANEMPTHNHGGATSAPPCSTGPGTNNVPAARFAGVTTRPRYGDAANGSLAGGNSSAAGGGQPHTNLQPYLTINFCIALQGIYPTRN